MARARAQKTNFVAGELDSLLHGRVDVSVYYNGAKRLRNVIVRPQGGIATRPGSDFVAAFAGADVGRLISFEFSTEQTYLIALTDHLATIYRNSEQVAQLATIFPADTLKATFQDNGDMIQSGVTWTQSKDALILFHENHPPQILRRGVTHSDWTIADVEFSNIPIQQFGETDYDQIFAAVYSFGPAGGANGANAGDQDAETFTTITNPGDLTLATLATRIVFIMDLGADQNVGHVEIKNISQALNASSFRVAYSSDALAWSVLPEQYAISTGPRDYGISLPLVGRYVAIVLEERDYTADGDISLSGMIARPGTSGVDEVQKLTFPNPGSQGNWTEGDTFKLILEDEETDNIEMSLTAATLAARIERALLALPNVKPNSIECSGVLESGDRIVTVKFLSDNGSRPWGALGYTVKSAEQIPTIDAIVTVEGQYPGEPVWSFARGFPRCGVFFQGRLWLAGSPSLPNTLWASRSGAPFDFNDKRSIEDYGFTAPTDTDDVPAFLSMFAGRHLQLFSASSEFYIPISNTEAVTPENVVLRRSTSRGCKAGLRPLEVDGGTLFVQRAGRSIREFIFADVEQAYQANNLSLYASHLVRDPVGFALRKSTSTEDADYIFAPNADGSMLVFCTLRTQEVNASMLWTTKGDYHDVAVILSDVYFMVHRVVNGDRVLMIEKMTFDHTFDCAISGAAATDAIDIPHLPGASVEYSLDGVAGVAGVADASGSVPIHRAASSWVCGYGWPDADPDYPGLRWLVVTLPYSATSDGGQDSGLGIKKRIVDVECRLINSNGFLIGGNRIATRETGVSNMGDPSPLFTGIKRLKGLYGWSYDAELVIGNDRSGVITLTQISYGVAF